MPLFRPSHLSWDATRDANITGSTGYPSFKFNVSPQPEGERGVPKVTGNPNDSDAVID